MIWTIIESIGTAIGAIATSVAVFLTLWQLKRHTARRLKITFLENMLIHGEEEKGKYIFFQIHNDGDRVVQIHSIGISTIMKNTKIVLLNNSFMGQGVDNPIFPYTLGVNEIAKWAYKMENFEKTLIEYRNKKYLDPDRKLKMFVTSVTGEVFYFKSNKKIKDYIGDR